MALRGTVGGLTELGTGFLTCPTETAEVERFIAVEAQTGQLAVSDLGGGVTRTFFSPNGGYSYIMKLASMRQLTGQAASFFVRSGSSDFLETAMRYAVPVFFY